MSYNDNDNDAIIITITIIPPVIPRPSQSTLSGVYHESSDGVSPSPKEVSPSPKGGFGRVLQTKERQVAQARDNAGAGATTA
jgi:hypothetical protein